MNKPERLTDREFEIAKAHTLTGHELVAASVALADAAPVVRGHHERIDGRGYPDGLAADEIPLGARVVAVCDAYDAMAHTRQYREGMGRDKAISILREHSGSQWDSEVVDALVAVLERGGLELDPTVFDDVGRDEAPETTVMCCHDALPSSIARVA